MFCRSPYDPQCYLNATYKKDDAENDFVAVDHHKTLAVSELLEYLQPQQNREKVTIHTDQCPKPI